MIEKAKKAADELQDGLVQFEIHPRTGQQINTQPQKTEKKIFDYDESYFTFKLEGGPKHSEPLIANARIAQGSQVTA